MYEANHQNTYDEISIRYAHWMMNYEFRRKMPILFKECYLYEAVRFPDLRYRDKYHATTAEVNNKVVEQWSPVKGHLVTMPSVDVGMPQCSSINLENRGKAQASPSTTVSDAGKSSS
ncbi:hypothetical protein PG996_014548 [Apiospora saccharicola]|uniref:Uncharacterized protein n=1 Tax=Apiospora saccharicola TaxID=335842 RepID=A0ABR1TIM2_9PEZI